MKTRSRNNNLRYERESDSDDSTQDRRLKKRNRLKLSGYNTRYGRSFHIGMPIHYSGKSTHMPVDMGREHQTGEKLEKKHSPVMSAASHSSSSHPYINGNETVSEEKSVRRSTRQRKFIYDNLNQTWLLAPGLPDFSKLESFLSSPQQSPVKCEDRERRHSERNQNHEINRLGINSDSLDFDDMYSRVKRERRKAVHDFYGNESPQDGGSMADTEDTDRNGLSDSDSLADTCDLDGNMQTVGVPQEDTVNSNKYSLRPKKPITERFQFPIEPARPRRSAASSSLFDAPRHHRRPRDQDTYKSVHRIPLFRRKRHVIPNSSSCSSSDEERRFEKRKKACSIGRSRNRCLPVNMIEEELTKGVLRDRMKIGCNLADIDPVSIDKSITFDSIGGLDHHIQALKEMILFPLMYPEVFERFKITPPRGVLFHGQPGTGKTLVARALANECSNNDRRIAFFMRKGADCLSKWVGESERQLRLLFEQAYSMRPSIIFFDEIDGLAPVRSTRQDQIHSSIVSTLLALMDGVDSRGEIVVIGATNRIDAIDPALRRAGRFDREMLFPLPSNEARQRILKIHMQKWNPPQSDSVISELASRSVGYCGADLKALCTEAALVALRRRYPQIYGSKEKLQLDVNSIQVTAKDFIRAMRRMKPSVQRSSIFSAKPLPEILKPLLDNILQEAVSKLQTIFPVSATSSKHNSNRISISTQTSSLYDASSDESDSSVFEEPKTPNGPETERSRYLWPFVHRPRLIISGEQGQGQGALAPALLYLLEHIPVHRLDIATLYAVTCKSPEEACAQVFQEAQRNLPSIIFLPHIAYWWETLSDTVRATFLSLLQDLDPCTPILLLATSDCPFHQLPAEARAIFGPYQNHVLNMRNPSEDCRRKFFSILSKEVYVPPRKKMFKETVIETLKVAPKPTIRQLSVEEQKKLWQKEEATMRELRLFLRDILNKLARDRRFYIFARPVDPQEVPDYQEVIKNPMDLETMMTKIDLHKYETVSQFLGDVDLVCQNALEYNPDRDPSDKLIRHRACALKDIAHALILSELDDEFEKICQDIHNSRKERGLSKHTGIVTACNSKSRSCGLLVTAEREPQGSSIEGKTANEAAVVTSPDACPTRFSKRIRGLGTLSDGAVDEDDNKKENFPVSNRVSRYMIWRRKKSPWFGSCRRKLIRRTINNSSDGVPRKKFKNSNKLLKFKSPRSLSPIQETNHLESTRPRRTASPTKDSKMESSPRERSPAKSPVGMITREKSLALTSPNSRVTSPRLMSPNSRVVEPKLLSPKLLSPRMSPKISPKTKSPSSSSSSNNNNNEINANNDATSVCDDNAVSCDIFLNTMCSKDSSKIQSLSNGLYNKMEEDEEEQNLSGKISLLTLPAAETEKKSISSDRVMSPTLQVTVDRVSLQQVFNHLVKVSENWNVETLQYMFSTLHSCIHRHRKEWDKKDLVRDLQEEIHRFQQQRHS